MYAPKPNKYSEKGRTLLLLEKRNKQFHDLFLKIKDPVSILQFYQVIRPIYEKYFHDERKADLWVKVLWHVSEKLYFWNTDLHQILGISKVEADNLLKRMGKRHLLTMTKMGTTKQCSLSSDGYLFLKNFSKECVSAALQVVRNGRTGKNRITSTLKKKKK